MVCCTLFKATFLILLMINSAKRCQVRKVYSGVQFLFPHCQSLTLKVFIVSYISVISHVVTGETDSPTAAHAGCKRQRKGIPGAWGYRWGTLPQWLEIWWTGLPGWGLGNRSTTHHCKTAVMKRKLWPLNSPTNWN